MNTQAKFRSLQESEKEDWQLIFSEFSRFAKALPDRVMTHLKLLEGRFWRFSGRPLHPFTANGHPRVSRWPG